MKKNSLCYLIIFFFAFSGSGYLFAQDDAQKAMMEYMTPGKMHQMLAKNAGEWKTKFKVWMQPGAEPASAEGTAAAEMLLGGRYLQTKHSGTIMGMPMNGIGIDGFDNCKKVFTSVWIDNLGTGVMLLEGTYDEASKTFTYTGKSFDPVSKKEIAVREVLKYVNDDLQIMEMFMTLDGKESKSMEVEMTRVK